MKNSYMEREIIANEEIAPGIYKMLVKTDDKVRPGQFYMVRAWQGLEPFLARPISVSDYRDGRLSLLYARLGRGTDLMSKLGPGDSISLLGPLGNGFETRSDIRIALVAGGIGIAPLLYLAKETRAKIDLYAGFREETYYLDEFKGHVDRIEYSTEDGSKGHKGYVTDLINPDDYDLVIGCGPTAMMKALQKKCEARVRLEISLENRMACGIGSCMGCTVETKNGMERVCKEGPVVLAEEVIFND